MPRKTLNDKPWEGPGVHQSCGHVASSAPAKNPTMRLVLTQHSPKRGPDAQSGQDFLKRGRRRAKLAKTQITIATTITPESDKSNRNIPRRANLRSSTLCSSKWLFSSNLVTGRARIRRVTQPRSELSGNNTAIGTAADPIYYSTEEKNHRQVKPSSFSRFVLQPVHAAPVAVPALTKRCRASDRRSAVPWPTGMSKMNRRAAAARANRAAVTPCVKQSVLPQILSGFTPSRTFTVGIPSLGLGRRTR